MGANKQPTYSGGYDQFGWHTTVVSKGNSTSRDTLFSCMFAVLFVLVCVLVIAIVCTL